MLPIYFGIVDIDFNKNYEIFCIKETGAQGYKKCYLYEIQNNTPHLLTEFYGFSRDGNTKFCEVDDVVYIYSQEKHSNQRKSIVISAIKNNEVVDYLTCYQNSSNNNGIYDEIVAKQGEEIISEQDFNKLLNEFISEMTELPSIYITK
jgi:hypothetical protein